MASSSAKSRRISWNATYWIIFFLHNVLMVSNLIGHFYGVNHILMLVHYIDPRWLSRCVSWPPRGLKSCAKQRNITFLCKATCPYQHAIQNNNKYVCRQNHVWANCDSSVKWAECLLITEVVCLVCVSVSQSYSVKCAKWGWMISEKWSFFLRKEI